MNTAILPFFPPKKPTVVKMPSVCKVKGTVAGIAIQAQIVIKAIKILIYTISRVLLSCDVFFLFSIIYLPLKYGYKNSRDNYYCQLNIKNNFTIKIKKEDLNKSSLNNVFRMGEGKLTLLVGNIYLYRLLCFILYHVFVFVFSRKCVILCYGEKNEDWKC